MEFIQGLITGYLLSHLGLIALCVIGVLCAAYDCKVIAGFLIIAAVWTATQIFPAPGAIKWIIPPIYLLVGVIWSMWRYKRHVDDAADRYSGSHVEKRAALLASVRPSAMLGEITGWVLIWPFSMVASVIGDSIKLVQHAIKNWLNSVYEGIFNSAAKRLAEAPAPGERNP